MQFELRGLPDFKDETLLKELRRVADLIPLGKSLTRKEFDKHAKASASVISRRFGGWEQALTKVGLSSRYSGRLITEKMRAPISKQMSLDELKEELQKVAKFLKVEVLSKLQFNRHSKVGAKIIKSRFGSWEKGLNAAGLRLSNLGKRYSANDYFENLLQVWTHYGRQPTYGEMDKSPSKIGSGAYEHRWGTWRKALMAFVEYANSSATEIPKHETSIMHPPQAAIIPSVAPEDQRKIPLGLRFQVFKRDRYKCVLCGRSPATTLDCELHVDHITPFSDGGKTISDNLQTLCAYCNLGKGAKAL